MTAEGQACFLHPRVLDDVEKKLPHRAEQGHADLFGLDAQLFPGVDGHLQAIPLPGPGRKPFHHASQLRAVLDGRAQLGGERTGDVQALFEHRVDLVHGFTDALRNAGGTEAFQAKPRPRNELLKLVVEDPADPSPLAFFRLHQLDGQ